MEATAMVTVRQMEREWEARRYEKLLAGLATARPEEAFAFDASAGRSIPAAAMALVRLEELNQAHLPFYARLVRALLAAQSATDGGWGDPAVTALCLRALMAGRGCGLAIERGLDYLAGLQKADGLWPAGPIRRMPADPVTSAFLLYQLGDKPAFRGAVRFDEAVDWFESRGKRLGADAKAWWELAGMKCRCPVFLFERDAVALS
jgi:hypothetical protein